MLFTTRDYSVTTSGHKWTVLGPCKHLTVFHVQHPTDTDRKAQFAEYRERYTALGRKYSRGGATNRGFSAVRNLVDEANRFAQFFGLRCQLCPTIYRAWWRSAKQSRRGRRARKQREEAKRQREWEGAEGGSYGQA